MPRTPNPTRLKPGNQRIIFACFACRIVQKEPSIAYFSEIYSIVRGNLWDGVLCRSCRQPTAYLGRYFKAPKKNDERQWRKIEILWHKGWMADGWRGENSNLVRGFKSPRDARNLEIEERAVLARITKAEKRAARIEHLLNVK